jgi:hypothetical protein
VRKNRLKPFIRTLISTKNIILGMPHAIYEKEDNGGKTYSLAYSSGREALEAPDEEGRSLVAIVELEAERDRLFQQLREATEAPYAAGQKF